jgi:hypothetical protein
VATAAGAIAIAGCGSVVHFRGHSRAATPVNLSVYIDDSRVTISPRFTGGGPVVFDVTNQSARAASLTITRTSGGVAPISTGPIAPSGTDQVAGNLSAGLYSVAARTASGSPVAATLRVGRSRPAGNSALLQP